MNSVLTVLRSTLYSLLQIIITPLYFLIILASFPLPPIRRYRITSGWAHIMLFLLRLICGIRYRINGVEHIPEPRALFYLSINPPGKHSPFSRYFPPRSGFSRKNCCGCHFLAGVSP